MFPKIKSARPLSNYRLLIVFQNDVTKLYDCTPLLEQIDFSPLMEVALFAQVRVANGGYGIIWNDDIDLSESELWLNGTEVEDTLLESAQS